MISNVIMTFTIAAVLFLLNLNQDIQKYHNTINLLHNKTLLELEKEKYNIKNSLLKISDSPFLSKYIEENNFGDIKKLLLAENQNLTSSHFFLIKDKCKSVAVSTNKAIENKICDSKNIIFESDKFWFHSIGKKIYVLSSLQIINTIENYHLLSIKEINSNFLKTVTFDSSIKIAPTQKNTPNSLLPIFTFKDLNNKNLASMYLNNSYFNIYPTYLLKKKEYYYYSIFYLLSINFVMILLNFLTTKNTKRKIEKDIQLLISNKLLFGTKDSKSKFIFRSKIKNKMTVLKDNLESLYSQKEKENSNLSEILTKKNRDILKLEKSQKSYKNQFQLAILANSNNLKTEITFNKLKEIVTKLDSKNHHYYKNQSAKIVENSEILSDMCREWWEGLQIMSPRKFFRNLSETPSEFHNSKLEESLAIIKKIADQLAISSIQTSLSLNKNIAKINEAAELISNCRNSKIYLSGKKLYLVNNLKSCQDFISQLTAKKIKFSNSFEISTGTNIILEVFSPILSEIFFHIQYGLTQYKSNIENALIKVDLLEYPHNIEARFSSNLENNFSEQTIEKEYTSNCFSIAKELCNANDVKLNVEFIPQKDIFVSVTIAKSFFEKNSLEDPSFVSQDVKLDKQIEFEKVSS